MSVLLSLTIDGVTLSTPVLVAIALPVAFVLYTVWLHSGYTRANPIVWSWVPHLRSALLFGQDPNAFLAACKKQYGPVFTVNLGGKLMTFVTDPACYPHITRAREGLSFSAVAASVGQAVLGQSPEISHDAEIDAAVHAQYIKYLSGPNLDDITRKFQQHLQLWLANHLQEQQQLQQGGAKGAVSQTGLLELVTAAIFSSATRSLYGELLVEDGSTQTKEFGPTFADDFQRPHTWLSTFQAFDSAFPLLYGGLPHFLLRKGLDARERMVRTLQTLRADSAPWHVARQELMVASPPNPRPKTDLKDFGCSQLGQLWALQGNTIPASFWTLFFLLQNPAAMKKVQAELNEAVAQARRDDPNAHRMNVELSRDALKKLVVLDAVISESLRMATGSMMLRRATTDLVLDLPTGPLPVKSGASIAIYPFITHHDASLFASPDEFQLERFLDLPVENGTMTDVNGVKVPHAFLPFGSGISMCPGRHFARNEIKIFCVTFLSAFELEAADNAAPLQHPGYLLSRAGLGIFPPAKDVQVKYSPKA